MCEFPIESSTGNLLYFVVLKYYISQILLHTSVYLVEETCSLLSKAVTFTYLQTAWSEHSKTTVYIKLVRNQRFLLSSTLLQNHFRSCFEWISDQFYGPVRVREICLAALLDCRQGQAWKREHRNV